MWALTEQPAKKKLRGRASTRPLVAGLHHTLLARRLLIRRQFLQPSTLHESLKKFFHFLIVQIITIQKLQKANLCIHLSTDKAISLSL